MWIRQLPINITILFYTQICQGLFNIRGFHTFFQQNFFYLFIVKDEVPTFLSGRVCIGSREIEPFFHKILFHLSNSFNHYLFVERIFSDLVEFYIHRDQLCIGIKHLFKMRNMPLFICSITEKTATYLIVNATLRHFF